MQIFMPKNFVNKEKLYYFVDVDLNTLKFINWGITHQATLTGNTDNFNTHRVFLTKGQYNKKKKLLPKNNPKSK